MIVNLRAYGVSQDMHKLTQTLILINKYIYIYIYIYIRQDTKLNTLELRYASSLINHGSNELSNLLFIDLIAVKRI